MNIHTFPLAERRIESLPKSTISLDTLNQNIDGVIPYFQSFWDIKNDCVGGVESLMRLKDEDGNVFTPYDFLEVSVTSGLYTQMQRTLIGKVFETLEYSPLEFSINLFPSDIEQGELTKDIIDLVSSFRKEGKAIVEILEWEGVENDRVFCENLDALKSAGILLALDDFGSRSSDVHRLEKYLKYIDKVKFDGTRFIRDIHINREKKNNFLQAVAQVRSYGIQSIVAERVESLEIYNIVKNAGVNIAQGYYIDEPQAKLPALNKKRIIAA